MSEPDDDEVVDDAAPAAIDKALPPRAEAATKAAHAASVSTAHEAVAVRKITKDR